MTRFLPHPMPPLFRDADVTMLPNREPAPWDADQFIFVRAPDRIDTAMGRENAASSDFGRDRPAVANAEDDGRNDPVPVPDPVPIQPNDGDPDPAPPPLDQPDVPAGPQEDGRPVGSLPGLPVNTPPAPPPGPAPEDSGRAPGTEPGPLPDPAPVTGNTSGGPAESSYNVAIDFIGSWSVSLQDAFVEAAEYLSAIILADLPDTSVEGTLVDDIAITATLENIDGVGGVLGSAGPRTIRDDGSFLPATGSMTFDSADAQNQLGLGNWETIVLHEMMHALGFGTLWSFMGLTSGSVAGGDIRFTGVNATDVYQTEFADIAGGDPGAALGVPVETVGGPGTAGGHWEEALFDLEIMTGFVDQGSFVSDMTIAALEDMGYDTVYDDPYISNDQSGPIPVDPLFDLIA